MEQKRTIFSPELWGMKNNKQIEILWKIKYKYNLFIFLFMQISFWNQNARLSPREKTGLQIRSASYGSDKGWSAVTVDDAFAFVQTMLVTIIN